MKRKTATSLSKNKTEKNKSFPIVAIGASAGGLEAITQLLKNLPADTGMAYVYIQHLDPTHESMLVPILSKSTDMKVMEVTHLLTVEPNNVYIIPPNKDMVLVRGEIRLKARALKPSVHMPIDQFFLSLAEHQRETAIGIILSGNASDGTLGMKAIKIAGGITFAQDESAKFQSMPKSAIFEGAVDLILSPEEIAQELVRLSKQKHVMEFIHENVGTASEDSIDEDLGNILQLLNKSTGVDFSHYKKNTIQRRIVRRMLLYKQQSLREYTQYLKQHAEEISTLYQDLLINVTSFFRYPEATEYLRTTIFPRILKGKTTNDPIRIWVPACSTGEEAYSIAMILIEVLGDKASSVSIQIFATDLSENAINKARMGIYTPTDLAEVSQKRIQRFFTKVDGNYRIVKSIRDLCVFAPHNIFKDPPFSRIDFISCCNLMIYLENVLQKKVIATFHYALNSTGFLLLGRSETIGTSNLFTPVEKKFKVYARKKDTVSRAVFDMTYRIPESDKTYMVRGAKEGHKTSFPVNDIEKMVDNLLLNKYVPSCVVINHELEIIQFRGSTGLFLEPSPGRASLNLLKMARQGLSFELRNAVHKVIKTGQPFKKSGLEIQSQNNTHYVSIEVVPLSSDLEERHFLVVFEELNTPIISQYTSPSRDRRIKQLEQELIAAKEDMRSIIEEQEAVNEELQSANEEIVSSNEELQSINEELETSKEEVESTNEELMTINQELQIRNEQLGEAYEYSEAVFSTIRQSVVVIDNDLRIKKGNKSFFKTFKIKEDDVEGRSIYDIGNRQWDIPQMHRLLEEIIPNNNQFYGFELENEFEDIGKKVLLLNAKKVVQKSHRQQLIILAIEDITEHVNNVKLIAEREEWFHTMADNAPVMIWVSDENRLCNYFNKSWLEFTGRTLKDELGNGWALGIHKDDLDKVLKTYSEAFDARDTFRMEYRLRRHDGEYRWIYDIGKPNYGPDGKFMGYIGSCTEIHDQRIISAELEQRVTARTKALKDANVDLERSNDELQQFAYVASHDLKEPLRKIVTFTDLLQNELDAHINDDSLEYLEKISNSASRMTQLIDDLLNFSGLRKIHEEFEIVNLNELVKSVLKDFELSISQKKVKIEVTELPVINAIKVQMDLLFHNLISNALKFNDPDKKLIISVKSRILSPEEILNHPQLKKNTAYAEIVVKDNGIGFDQQYADQIFILFQRLNYKHSFQGTGLGLAIVKKIVAYHEGLVYAVSKENEGAAFHIILPIDQVHES